MAVAGASRYLNAATLSNMRGFAPTGGLDIIGSLGAVDILDIGRAATGDNGIGLSGSARQLNKQFLSSSKDTFNAIFSLGVASTSSVEGLQTQIKALRASLPQSRLGDDFFAEGASDSERGSNVDTTA